MIPGIMAPTGMGSIISGRVGALLEIPTFGQWLAAKCGGVAVAGIQRTATETVILASGTFVVNYPMVGVAFEAGVTCWVIDSSLCY